MHGAPHALDARDWRIIAERVAALDADPEPRCGDYVEFANRVTRRVSHVYPRDWGDMAGVQTSDGGSWHLGTYGVSFSGALYPHVPMDSLTRTTRERLGSAWIFHHGYATAHNGVDFMAPFRVYTCTEDAPK